MHFIQDIQSRKKQKFLYNHWIFLLNIYALMNINLGHLHINYHSHCDHWHVIGFVVLLRGNHVIEFLPPRYQRSINISSSLKWGGCKAPVNICPIPVCFLLGFACSLTAEILGSHCKSCITVASQKDWTRLCLSLLFGKNVWCWHLFHRNVATYKWTSVSKGV